MNSANGSRQIGLRTVGLQDPNVSKRLAFGMVGPQVPTVQGPIVQGPICKNPGWGSKIQIPGPKISIEPI